MKEPEEEKDGSSSKTTVSLHASLLQRSDSDGVSASTSRALLADLQTAVQQ